MDREQVCALESVRAPIGLREVVSAVRREAMRKHGTPPHLLVRLRAGVPVERKLLRRDKYAPVRGILLPPQAEGETGNNADGEELPSTGAHSG